MTTTKERISDTESAERLARMSAGSDQNALDYLYMICRLSRIIDDVYDDDVKVSRESLLLAFEMLFIKMPTNSFYANNQDVLVSQHLSMWNAWMAANRWENGDKIEQIYSHVWRDTIHEVFPIVALLTQDYEAMKRVSEEMRSEYKKSLGG
tara:strand:- start:639 stop:1091 length:453 start_codon:yes stop_codon:yes gene_type:complete